jgi:hypothetical protein
MIISRAAPRALGAQRPAPSGAIADTQAPRSPPEQQDLITVVLIACGYRYDRPRSEGSEHIVATPDHHVERVAVVRRSADALIGWRAVGVENGQVGVHRRQWQGPPVARFFLVAGCTAGIAGDRADRGVAEGESGFTRSPARYC